MISATNRVKSEEAVGTVRWVLRQHRGKPMFILQQTQPSYTKEEGHIKVWEDVPVIQDEQCGQVHTSPEWIHKAFKKINSGKQVVVKATVERADERKTP